MKFDLSDDSYGVEASKHDVELAREVKGVAESVRDLATYVVGEGRQGCHFCGKTRPCRPLAAVHDNGQVGAVPTCAACQREQVEAKIEHTRQQAAEDGDE